MPFSADVDVKHQMNVFIYCYVLWCIQINQFENFFDILLSILNEFFELNFDSISRINFKTLKMAFQICIIYTLDGLGTHFLSRVCSFPLLKISLKLSSF